LLIVTITFAYIVYISSGFIRSFSIAVLITNIGYHAVALFDDLHDVGEYRAMKGILIWYATTVIVITTFIEIVF